MIRFFHKRQKNNFHYLPLQAPFEKTLNSMTQESQQKCVHFLLTDYIFLVLLVGHILAIVGWMGAAFLFTSVLGPSLEKMANEARSEFLIKTIPRYSMYVASTSGAAILLGASLYGYSYVAKDLSTGIALNLLQAGAGTGLIAFIVVMAIVLPSARHLLRLLREGQAGTVQPAGRGNAIALAQSRVRTGTAIVFVLLILAVVLMVVGATI